MSSLLRILSRLFLLKVIVNRWKSARPAADTPAPRRDGDSPDGATAPRENKGIPAQGRSASGPDTPLDLEAGDWKATLRRTLKEIKADRVTLIAAGMAYYFFLAIFPALIAAVGILGLAEIDTADLVDSIRESLPGGSGAVLVEAVASANEASESASLAAAIAGIAAALWSASSGMVALQAGLNVAYDVPSDRKLIGKRGMALLLVLLTGIFGGVPSPIFTFGESTPFVILGWVLTVAAVIVLFSLYYYLGPKRESPKWQWVSTGGVIGALLWILGSVGFALYANSSFAKYNETYGAIGGVIVLIFLLYLSSVAILVGGEWNAELERQASRKA